MAYVNQRTIQKIIDRKIEAFISEIEEKKSWDLKGLNLKVLDTSKNMIFIKKTIIQFIKFPRRLSLGHSRFQEIFYSSFCNF